MSTHFADESTGGTGAQWHDPTHTLCGLRIEGIIMRDPRRPDCAACERAHQRAGWTFPLPENVTALP